MEKVESVFYFSKEEEKTLKYWQEINAFETSLKMSEGKPEFSFYDGPPFATGLPHYGHILAGTIKDTVTRYAHQNGHHVTRRFGWDCHGVPIEFEIDKMYKVKSKEDVLKMGISSYNEKCRSIVMKYSEEWKQTVSRMGRWIDMENNYKTMDTKYMESVWWVFKQLYEKNLVYFGFKVMPYSTACTTPLSNFEASSNYQNTTDPSLVVSFPAVGKDFSFLAWTTTPWTLPANLVLTVNPNFEYLVVQDLKRSNQNFVLAKCRVSMVYKDESEYKVLQTLKGSDLVGLQYEPLFNYFKYESENGCFRVLSGDFVTKESGTGIVHTAPSFGEDDFNQCLKDGVVKKGDYKRPVLNTVDDDGRLSKDVTDFAGQYVKDADKNIILKIKEMGRLLSNQSITHSYPFCYRSDTPLIYRAIGSWFLNVESFRNRLLDANEKTHWVPDYVKDKRFTNWLKSAVDWNFSRNRYWGTPIPIWMSEDREEVVVVGSVQELEQLTGTTGITDLHRHNIDHLTIPSSHGKGVLRRIEPVFDCWFESGSMPYAQAHYPFENPELFSKTFPADFIAEGLDQTRGWFYTLLVLSVALFDNKAPFKNLICNGMVLGNDGKKMSKSKKNYTDPNLIIDQYGADAVRIYLITSPVVRGEQFTFDDKKGVKMVIQNVFLPWFNVYRFFVQNVHRYEKLSRKQFVPDVKNAQASPNLMDKWIMASCQSLIQYVHKEMTVYRLDNVVPHLLTFIEQLTKWYVRLNRKRFKGASTEQPDQTDILFSLDTLYQVLMTLSVVMAPFTPFFSEHTYQNLKKLLPKDQQMDSVHYIMYPEPNKDLLNPRIETAVSHMQEVIEMVRVSRDRRNKSLRLPLKEFQVISSDADYLQDLKELEAYILEDLNLVEIKYTFDGSAEYYTLKVDSDKKRLGARLKNDLGKVSLAINQLTKQQLSEFQSKGQMSLHGHLLTLDDIKITKEYKLTGFDKNLYEVSTNSSVLTVLNLEFDQQLYEKGLAREFMSRVQKFRRDQKLTPEDEVDMYYHTDNEELKKVVENNQSFVQSTILHPIKFGSVEKLNSTPIVLKDWDPHKNLDDSNEQMIGEMFKLPNLNKLMCTTDYRNDEDTIDEWNPTKWNITFYLSNILITDHLLLTGSSDTFESSLPVNNFDFTQQILSILLNHYLNPIDQPKYCNYISI
eukprot:gene4567-5691_t